MQPAWAVPVVMHAYAPLREPREERSLEDMQRVLAKHAQGAKPEVAVKVESRPAERAVAPLVWEKPVKTSDDGLGYQQSTCHRFVIAKVRVMDRFQYTASMRRRTPVGDPFPAQALGSFYTPEEARACCEGHR